MSEGEKSDDRWERLRRYLRKELGDEPYWFKDLDSPSDYDLNTGNTATFDDPTAAKPDLHLQKVQKEELTLFVGRYRMREKDQYRWLEESLWTINQAAILLCGLNPDRYSHSWGVYWDGASMNGGCVYVRSHLEKVISLLTDVAHADDSIGVRVNDEMKVRVRECVQWATGKRSIQPIPIWLLDAFATSTDESHEIDENTIATAKTTERSSETLHSAVKPSTPRGNTRNKDGRSLYTEKHATRSCVALINAIWYLIHDEKRGAFWNGDRINATKLAKTACSHEVDNRIWSGHKDVPSASRVSETLQIAAQLDSESKTIRRRNTKLPAVQEECLLVSVLWCIQTDWNKCVRNNQLKHNDIIAMILDNYDRLWPQKEYTVGERNSAVDLLKRLTVRFR